MRPPPPSLPDRFTLGPWRVNASLDEVSGQGSCEGKLYKLEPRAMRLLVVLAQAGGDVVMADALLSAVWPGLVVTPSSLYDAVAQLRKVLGPDHIATVPRKGYRLVTPVMPDLPVAARAAAGAMSWPTSILFLATPRAKRLPFDGLPLTRARAKRSVNAATLRGSFTSISVNVRPNATPTVHCNSARSRCLAAAENSCARSGGDAGSVVKRGTAPPPCACG